MTDHISVALVDGGGITRGALMRRTAIGAGALVGAGVAIWGLPELSASADPSASQDAEILNFALTVERLKAAFYAEAARRAKLSGDLAQYVEVVGGHEREHAAFISKALGSKAGKAPTFDFGDSTSNADIVARTARSLEDLAVSAYNGQGPNLTPATLAAAGRIVSVEARHAAWIRDILGIVPAPEASDKAVTAQQATAAVKRTGFIK
jgi:hypothetical protein